MELFLKIFFNCSRYDSATNMLTQIGLPGLRTSINDLIHNFNNK